MTIIQEQPGGAAPGKGISRPKKVTGAKKGKTTKATTARKGRSGKARSAKAKSSGSWKEAVGVGAGASKQTGALPAGGHAAGSGRAALDLADLGGGTVAGAGLGDVLLDLVGEGRVLLSHALRAWQREQDRVANRAWRRPGGMVRMGGV